MKLIIPIILISCWTRLCGQNDSLLWMEALGYKLKISDFMGKDENIGPYAAKSYITTRAKIRIVNDTMFFKMYCVFDKTKSWIKKGQSVEYNVNLLLHEQGHFNIWEIFVRKTKQCIISNQGTITKNNYKDIISDCYGKYQYDLEKKNEAYDIDTDFAREEQSQKVWSERLENELRELRSFSGDYIFIALNRK